MESKLGGNLEAAKEVCRAPKTRKGREWRNKVVSRVVQKRKEFVLVV